MKVEIACKGADLKDIEELSEFQGSIKSLSAENFEKLKRTILENGFSAPMFVWQSEKRNWIIDGHQRLRVLGRLRDEGVHVPPIPIVYIEAETRKEAKRKLLSIASQYGVFDVQSLDFFIADDDLEIAELLQEIRLVDGELKLSTDGGVVEKAPKTLVCPNCGCEFGG